MTKPLRFLSTDRVIEGGVIAKPVESYNKRLKDTFLTHLKTQEWGMFALDDFS